MAANERSLTGQICLWVFWGFNAAMLLWAVIIILPSSNPHVENDGAIVAWKLVGLLIVAQIWVVGAAVTGAFAFFTRGRP